MIWPTAPVAASSPTGAFFLEVNPMNEYKNKTPKARVTLKIEDTLVSAFGSVICRPVLKELSELIFKVIEKDVTVD